MKGDKKMKKQWRKMVAGMSVFAMTAALIPSGLTVHAAEEGAGIPYTAEGTYDVTVPHVIVNQIYGGSDDGNASHSFIELYNQSGESVDLTEWKLAYRSSADGSDSDSWKYLELTGTIEANGYYLVRCAATSGSDYAVPEGDQEWDIMIHNKGVSVALLDETGTELGEDFTGAVTDENRPAGYVDLLAVQGNDAEDAQMPPVYEGETEAVQSKKKAVHRDSFADTDSNAADSSEVDYSEEVSEELGPHGPQSSGGDGGPTDPGTDGGDGGTDTPDQTYWNGSFQTDAPLQLDRTGDVSLGTPNADGGVAEIVSYNSDNGKAYVVNGQQGLLNVVTVNADGSLTTESSIQVQNLISGFSYGDMTSVAVDTVNDRVVIALQAADYSASGRIAVLDYEGNLVADYETGVQPDMVTVSSDGKWILTADEGEPREGYGAGTVDPAGSVTVVNTETGETRVVGFDGFDSAALASQGILFNKVDGQILSAANDLEPEYIALNADGTKAYVTLQEANAIATLDIEAGTFTSIASLGFQDLSSEANSVDLVEDDGYGASVYPNTYGVRMPDGISAFEVNGTTYLATANEGDAREWGDFINEAEVTLTDAAGNEAADVRVLDQNVTAGLDAESNYLFGSRSFTIYNADTMELVYDSANEFESRTASYLSWWFNSSNDDSSVDDRSAKKGPEPESVIVKQIGNSMYAFIGLERIGGVMVYDVTNPSAASFVNYINTRDFSDDIAGDVSPEGLAFVPAEDSPSGSPILLAACEVSGTMAAYTLSGSAVVPGTPEESAGAVVLYTNDVHCAIDGYSYLAAYRAQLIEDGYDVITVDIGDAIQGEAVGSLTEGADIVSLMNAVGYDFGIPGNHEFDYGMERFLTIASEEAEYEYLSSNFVDLRTEENVFAPYRIVEMNGEDVAFVGISTPETYTKSTPTYFQDENGNFIYSFSEDTFYETIQNAVDSAVAEGADRVIALGHLGIEGTTEGWKSTDVIANTTGIDAFIDAHSHETIAGDAYANADGEMVPLTSTGTKFADFGVMTFNEDGTCTTELLAPSEVNINSSGEAAAAYQSVQAIIDECNENLAYLNEEMGTSEVELTINDESGTRRIRNGETNMGDFVADAYRTVTGADIALVNGGGIRASIDEGTVTRKELMDVNPWNNEMCVIYATGQQILDALEHGARMNPEESGGFLQVSGLTYEIHNYIESPVTVDEMGMFTGVDSTKERRVQNVMIGGEPVDPQKTYTVTGSRYTLLEGGDGFTMFSGAQEVQTETELPVDSEMLIQYFTENLGGVVSAEQYGSLTGDGRITIYAEEQTDPEEPGQNPGEDPDKNPSEDQGQNGQNGSGTQNGSGSSGNGSQKAAQTGDQGQVYPLIAVMIAAAVLAGGAGVYVVRRRR